MKKIIASISPITIQTPKGPWVFHFETSFRETTERVIIRMPKQKGFMRLHELSKILQNEIAFLMTESDQGDAMWWNITESTADNSRGGRLQQTFQTTLIDVSQLSKNVRHVHTHPLKQYNESRTFFRNHTYQLSDYQNSNKAKKAELLRMADVQALIDTILPSEEDLKAYAMFLRRNPSNYVAFYISHPFGTTVIKIPSPQFNQNIIMERKRALFFSSDRTLGSQIAKGMEVQKMCKALCQHFSTSQVQLSFAGLKPQKKVRSKTS